MYYFFSFFSVNPNGPELLDQLAPHLSELTNYNLNAKPDVALYSQL